MLGFRPTWRSPFIGINRFEASVEENVPYGKINVRPRSSSDMKSNPEQTQRSNMGSIPGKHSLQRGGVNCKAQRLRVEKMAIFDMDLEENASWDFTGNTIVKIERLHDLEHLRVGDA